MNYYYPNYYSTQPTYAIVNGIEDVRNFIVNPNCSVFLRDTNTNMCYEKWADAQGRYSMKIYKLMEVETKSEDIKRSDLDELEQRLTNLIKQTLGGTNEQSTTNVA